MIPIITIDGPGGAGKGTVAKRIASQLGWHLLDSGMLYRLLALAALHHHVAVDDEPSLRVMAGALDVHFVADDDSEGVRAFLEGEDVTNLVRSEDVGLVASKIAALTSVRKALLGRQRAFAEAPGLVADGRDAIMNRLLQSKNRYSLHIFNSLVTDLSYKKQIKSGII